MQNKTLSKNSTAIKSYLAVFILLTWRQLSLIIINKSLDEIEVMHIELVLYALFYISTILCSLFVSIFSEKTGKRLFMRLWTAIAIISSLVFIVFVAFNGRTLGSVIFSLFSGISVGMGIPICFASFADYTRVENRGRIGAFLFFLTSLFFALLISLSNIFSELAFSIFSIILLTIILLFSRDWREINKSKVAFPSVIRSGPFLSYFSAWCIYCFIDAFEAPLLQHFLDVYFGEAFMRFILSLMTIFASFSMLIAGFLADFRGRRNLLIYGFVMSGIAYVTVGIAAVHRVAWYLFSIVDGIATGFFLVMFIFTIWGDLSLGRSNEKYYAIGTAPFFFINFIKELFIPYLEMIPVSASFSLASFFLFLAVIPLLYAPETLPEKLIRRRELKKYVEKAKKIREKYEKQKED